jgi:hypothetical protein
MHIMTSNRQAPAPTQHNNNNTTIKEAVFAVVCACVVNMHVPLELMPADCAHSRCLHSLLFLQWRFVASIVGMGRFKGKRKADSQGDKWREVHSFAHIRFGPSAVSSTVCPHPPQNKRDRIVSYAKEAQESQEFTAFYKVGSFPVVQYQVITSNVTLCLCRPSRSFRRKNGIRSSRLSLYLYRLPFASPAPGSMQRMIVYSLLSSFLHAY